MRRDQDYSYPARCFSILRARLLMVIVLVAVLSSNAMDAIGDEPVGVRKEVDSAIRNALPFVQEKGDWWVQKKKCMSCHRVAFTAWSHAVAFQSNLSTDRKRINSWIDWSFGNLLSAIPEKNRKRPDEKVVDRNLFGAGQMLMTLRNWKASDSQKKAAQQVVDHLIRGQQENGSWVPRGQLPGQKRTLLETSHVVTMWNSLALMDWIEKNPANKSDVEPLISKASKFIGGYDEGQSQEWFALRMLFAHRLGDADQANLFRKKIDAMQNEDGGWSWIKGQKSDALATAQTIHLLLETGEPPNQKTVRAGVRFLLDSQEATGEWKVNGTKEKAKNRVTETATYWGTCWAVIALGGFRNQLTETVVD